MQAYSFLATEGEDLQGLTLKAALISSDAQSLS
jgi:hypothetical protein